MKKKLLQIIQQNLQKSNTKRTVKDVEKLIGCSVSQTEMFIMRVLYACSQQFNFWQNMKNGEFSSECVFQWVRGEKVFADICRNLKSQRKTILGRMHSFLGQNNSLERSVSNENFWFKLNSVWNIIPDPVYKKVVLARMLLKICNINVGHFTYDRACIDYNVLVALNKYKYIHAPGGEYQKTKLDKIRKRAYTVCCTLLNQLTDITPEQLDYVLWNIGRHIRHREGNVVVPKVKNETNY